IYATTTGSTGHPATRLDVRTPTVDYAGVAPDEPVIRVQLGLDEYGGGGGAVVWTLDGSRVLEVVGGVPASTLRNARVLRSARNLRREGGQWPADARCGRPGRSASRTRTRSQRPSRPAASPTRSSRRGWRRRSGQRPSRS